MDCSTLKFKDILKDFFANNKGICISYMIIAALYPLRNIVIPHMIGKLSKAISEKRNIVKNCIIIIIVVVVMQLLNICIDIIDVRIFPLLQKHIRDLLINSIFQSNNTQFEEVENGSIVAQIIRFPYVAYGHIVSWTDNYIPAIVTIIGTAVYIMFHNIYIAVVFSFIFILIFIIFRASFRGCKVISKKREKSYTQIFSQIDDTMNNLKTVLSFNMQEQEIERINESHPEYARLSENSVICSMKNKYVVMMLFIYIVVLTCSAYFASPRFFGHPIKIDHATFITLAIILYTIFTLLERINYQFRESIFKWGAIDNILNNVRRQCQRGLISEEEAIIAEDTNMDINELGIRFENVTFKHKNKVILDGINAFFPYQQKTLLVGEIGSGKTTMVNLMMMYYKANGGTIYMNGVPYSKMNLYNLRNKIGYLPQNPILFNRSIYENITFGLPNVDKEDVLKKFEELELGPFIRKFPKGIDTNVGNSGSALSGGQKQIIWIVKIALLNPEFIILDEPTAALDPDSKKIIYTLIEKLIVNKTIIMITHDTVLYNLADNIITLDRGKIKA